MATKIVQVGPLEPNSFVEFKSAGQVRTFPLWYYMHIHWPDDEAWHVLERPLRFRFPNREVDAPVGTTVFVPAGSPHTYQVTEPGRYLIFLTPRLDRLIAGLRSLSDQSELRATLAEFDTILVE